MNQRAGRRQRQAHAILIAADGAQDQRAAQRPAATRLVRGQPVEGMDGGIAGRRMAGVACRAAERDAQRYRAIGEREQVAAEQGLRLEVQTGLLVDLTDHRFDQVLLGIEMAGRLVQYMAAVVGLLDEQEAPVPLDDGGDGDMAGQAFSHAANDNAAARRAGVLQTTFPSAEADGYV